MLTISDRIKNIPVSASVSMTQRARELKANGVDVIALSTGEPDFPTPEHALEAAYQAGLSGDTRYPPTDGTPELKKAIQQKFIRDNKLHYDLNEITTAGGAKQVIFNTMLATLNEGDEVLIPTPSWISYSDIVSIAGGTPVPLPCSEDNGFKPLPSELDAAINEKTKWIIINYPNNPTGATASYDDLKSIARILLDYPHVHILSDDIYEHLIYDDEKFFTIAQVEPQLKDRTLVVNGVSKAYAMTGFRLGYCAGPSDLIKVISNINSQNSSGAATFSMAASAAVLNGPQTLLKERATIYQQRRDYVLERIAGINGLSCNVPQGAFYLFINVSGYIGKTTTTGTKINNDSDFVMALMEEQHVVTVQGAAYGMSPFLRISYATSFEQLEKGCNRIEEFCNSCS
ncbi:pyridoxal phosphate-dependent aminotransferase [Vibrio viridaestus]|uniref:Aminotransferase n=1 Tax=Vibrio viridaestus TaxID=2487322 RepID=A0A3N9TAL4_9VIBR|nr:pyridoxal phosphate-dependent aminotransferase [Vibrio viridaestus]RQW61207.1 pyridoxal phosphate-dependent aminotransferase [Vibrio viridaestus]